LLLCSYQAVLGIVRVGRNSRVRAHNYRLGLSVAGRIIRICCHLAGRLRYADKAVHAVVGIGGDSAAVCFREHVVCGIVGVAVGVDDSAVHFGIGECIQTVIVGIGVVFPGSCVARFERATCAALRGPFARTVRSQ